MSKDKRRKEQKQREESRFTQREGEWWETVCLHVCGSMAEQLLSIYRAAAPSCFWSRTITPGLGGGETEGGMEGEIERGGDEEREEVSGCVGGETGHV